VRVLEAGRIAAAVTGHTTGRLSAAHPWIYRPLRERLGAEAAALYASSQQQAVDHVAATVAELGIDCDLERRPSHVFITDEEKTEELRVEADAVKDAGLDAPTSPRLICRSRWRARCGSKTRSSFTRPGT
jgi:glycine/D-amino acid oxidase-like deaminating enzyme